MRSATVTGLRPVVAELGHEIWRPLLVESHARLATRFLHSACKGWLKKSCKESSILIAIKCMTLLVYEKSVEAQTTPGSLSANQSESLSDAGHTEDSVMVLQTDSGYFG